MRIAIIGSGIAGMTAAHLLHGGHEVHLFESESRPGGHANTVVVELPEGPVAVDTGFLVYNERTYPHFTRLLAGLRVGTEPSDMSFSLRDLRCGLEWRGTSLSTVFAQRRNALRPGFLAMLVDVARFNSLAKGVLTQPDDADGSLAELLEGHRWSKGFLEWYLVPLGSAIWSADPQTFTKIPARTFAEFFSRHGLLGPGHQPAWRTVSGGSARYVEALVAPLVRAGRLHLGTRVDKVRRHRTGVELLSAHGTAEFDHVVLATHSDQALDLLADATAKERAVLAAIRYQPNRATLHTDARVLPRSPRARAAWNYVRRQEVPEQTTLTYDLNRLQNLETSIPLLETLNWDDAIDPAKVLTRIEYAHPVVDGAAVSAQRHQRSLSAGSLSFCGAYWGYGFHEDGVNSALAVCERFGVSL